MASSNGQLARIAFPATLMLLAVGVAPGAAGEIYLQAGAAYQFDHAPCRTTAGEPVSWCRWDRTAIEQPLVHVEMGYAATRGRFSLSGFVRHESMATGRDYGVNQIGVAIRVRLWVTP